MTSKVFAAEFETIPLKLSWFAFLTITRSPLLLPCELCVMVNVVVDLVQDSPELTVELETIHTTCVELYAS